MRPNKRPLIYLLLVALLLLVGLLAACSNQGGQTSGGSQETGTSQPTESAVAEATSAVSEETGGEVAEVEVTRIVVVPVESAPSVAVPFYD